MNFSFLLQWIEAQSSSFSPFMLQLTVKGSLLLVLVFGFSKLLRKRSSAIRHTLWCMAFAALIVLPLAVGILPSWEVKGFPGFSNKRQTVEKQEIKRAENGTLSKNFQKGDSKQIIEKNQKSKDGEPVTSIGMTQSSRLKGWIQKPFVLVMAIWLLGILLYILRQIIGRISLSRIAKRAVLLPEKKWDSVVRSVVKKSGMKRPVKLLITDKIELPISWSIAHPKILLPIEAETWSNDRKRFVLLHEFAHVKRWDSLTQLLAQLVKTLFWFNPLMWFAYREFITEREHACDDFVLQEGSKASEYAGLLLDLARSLSFFQSASFATVAMARKSQLEGRLLSILNPHQNRSGLSRISLLGMALLLAILVLPLSAMRPLSSPNMINPQSMTGNETLENIETQMESENPEPVVSGTTHKEENRVEKSSNKEEHYTGSVQENQRDSIDRTNDIVKALCETLKDSDLDVRLQAAETLARLESKEAVPSLIEAAKDAHWKMRAAVSDALGSIEDRRGVPVLIQLLKDSEWHVRCEAAEALGDIKDTKAVNALSETLKDGNLKVRRYVVDALADIESEKVIEPLQRALLDSDWVVRRDAADALGDYKDASLIKPLTQASIDRHWEVRKAAVNSLGDFEDHRTINALTQALDDDRWEVRYYAVDGLGDLEEPSVIPALTSALHDDRIEVRKEAIENLGNFEDPQVIKPLAEFIQDPDWNIRKEVAYALGDIESPEAVPFLLPLINDRHPEVKRMGIWALGEIGDRKVVSALLPLLEDPSWEIREKAAWALGEIGDPAALESLGLKLKDDNEDVRKAAARALGEIRWQNE